MPVIPHLTRTVRPAERRRGLTLIELLVTVGIIALLAAILISNFGEVRAQARRAHCASNLHQIGRGFHMYAFDHLGMAMPLAYFDSATPTYWWGLDSPAGVDHTRGMLWPYLQTELYDGGVFECPSQPRGSYDTYQGMGKDVTSTYGYNGYFLSPAHTPGWSYQIASRPWQDIDKLKETSRTFAFADTMLLMGGKLKNTALLDPPHLFQGGSWTPNNSPTTSFRHSRRTNALSVDGHVEGYEPGDGKLISTEFPIGSVGANNDPHYVPDWADW